jgi:hypothetical protein
MASEEVAMKMFNLHLTGRISGKTFSGPFERWDRADPLKQLTHLNPLVDLKPSCIMSNPTAPGRLLFPQLRSMIFFIMELISKRLWTAAIA